MQKLNLKFDKNNFSDFKSFEKAVKKQVGSNCYVGTDSICVYFEFTQALKDMLRPFPKLEQFEFDLTASCPGAK